MVFVMTRSPGLMCSTGGCAADHVVKKWSGTKVCVSAPARSGWSAASERTIISMRSRIGRVMPPIIAVVSGALVVYQWAVARPLWLDEELIALNIRERGLLSLGGRLSFGQSAPYGWLALERLVVGVF